MIPTHDTADRADRMAFCVKSGDCAGATVAGPVAFPGEFGVVALFGRLLVLRLALIFFVVSLVAGLFGFTGISAATAGIARILFFIAIAIFLIFLVLALLGIQAFA